MHGEARVRGVLAKVISQTPLIELGRSTLESRSFRSSRRPPILQYLDQLLLLSERLEETEAPFVPTFVYRGLESSIFNAGGPQWVSESVCLSGTYNKEHFAGRTVRDSIRLTLALATK